MIQATETEPAVPADATGRDNAGRFSAKNTFGRANPAARHAQRLRQLFVQAVTEDDVKAIVSKLVAMAKDGDIQAANLLLQRAMGKPPSSDNALPLDDEQPEPLGPVTAENLEEHKRRLIQEISA